MKTVAAMYAGFRRPVYEIMARLFGRAVVRSPSARKDYIVSAEASLNHDATDRLEAIQARTLLVGGAQDKLFPAPLQNDTAKRIPNATPLLIEGVGHGAFDERKRDFDAAVKEFLSR